MGKEEATIQSDFVAREIRQREKNKIWNVNMLQYSRENEKETKKM